MKLILIPKHTEIHIVLLLFFRIVTKRMSSSFFSLFCLPLFRKAIRNIHEFYGTTKLILIVI